MHIFLITNPPLLEPQAICKASYEISIEITTPSCFASKKNSEKSKGHTRRN